MPTEPRAWYFPAHFLIESARLRIQPLVDDDASDLCRTAASPKITQAVYILRDGLSREQARKLIGDNDATNVLCGIWEKKSDTLIGAFRLHRHDDGSVEVGYWLDADWHGKGFAKEALATVLSYLKRRDDQPEVIAECKPTNGASRAILEKSGFLGTDEPGKRPGCKRFVYQADGLSS